MTEEGRPNNSGSVGAIDHVLKKTFSDYFFQNSEEGDGDVDGTAKEHDKPEYLEEDNLDYEESGKLGSNGVEKEIEEDCSEATGTIVNHREPQRTKSILNENPESEDSNDALSADLDSIESELAKKLQSAEDLEIYLEERKRVATVADEQHAADIYSKGLLIGAEFPHGRSLFSMDKSQLESFGRFGSNLILATDIMSENEKIELFRRGQIKLGESELCQIRPSTPNYQKLSPTKLLQVRRKYILEDEGARDEKCSENKMVRNDVTPYPKPQEKRPARMKSEERQYNEQRLQRLQKKTSFLKNPRFNLVAKELKDWKVSLLNKDLSEPPTFAQQELIALDSCQPNGFLEEDFDAVEAKQVLFSRTRTKDLDSELAKARILMKEDQTLKVSFRAEPSHARFEHYEINQPVKRLLKIFNVTSVSRSIRFLPPTSKYFSIGALEFPSGPGIVAPGMACSVEIIFCPDSLANYSDFITVSTETERYRIALVAKRRSPRLSIAETLSCGSCFVGGELKSSFACRNSGGAGNFQFLSEEEWSNPSLDLNYNDRDFITVGPFTISPVSFELAELSQTDINITFSPQGAGDFFENIILACDNCQVRKLTLKGSSCRIQIKISSLDNSSLDLENRMIKQPPAIIFDDTVVHSRIERSISISNPAPIALQFHWEILKPGANTKTKQKRKHKPSLLDDSNGVFSIHPPSGVLQPHTPFSFVFRFDPSMASTFMSLANLVIEKIPPTAVTGYLPNRIGKLQRSTTVVSSRNKGSLEENRNTFQALDLADEEASVCHITETPELLDIACLRLVLKGSGVVPICDFVPKPCLDLKHSVEIGHTYNISTRIRNNNPIRIHYRWTNLENRSVQFQPDMETGFVEPDEEKEIEISFVAFHPGKFTHFLGCKFVSTPQVLCSEDKKIIGHTFLRVDGQAVGPKVVLTSKELDFGLLSVNGTAEVELSMRNLSSIPATVTFQEEHKENIGMSNVEVPIKATQEKAMLLFYPSDLVVPPFGSASIFVRCQAGCKPERLRKVIRCEVRMCQALFIPVRGEIQSPKVFVECIRPSSAASGGSEVTLASNLTSGSAKNCCAIDLGTTYVTVPVVRVVRMVNLSNLPARYSWSELPFSQGASSRKSRASISGTAKPGQSFQDTGCMYEVSLSQQEGVLGAKEEREIMVRFNAIKPGRVSTMFVCDVEGMTHPIGFSLKTLSRGLVVTYSLINEETASSEMNATAPLSGDSNVGEVSTNSKLPILDFGNDVPLCERKSIRLSIVNHSAIRADYKCSVRNFAAPCIPKSILSSLKRSSRKSLAAGLTHSSSMQDPFGNVTSSTSSASSRSRSISRQSEERANLLSPTSQLGMTSIGSPYRGGFINNAILSNDHEETNVFSSEEGKNHTKKRIQAEEDRAVLQRGEGAAFLAVPAEGFLEPWQATIIEIFCFNNMSGTYRTELDCVIDGIPPASTTLKVTVVGSPLELQSNTVGLVTKKLANSSEQATSLNFGHTLVSTQPVRKVIRVKNNGPIPSKLSWRVVAKRAADADLVKSEITISDTSVQFTVSPHPDLFIPPPFTVEPVEQITPSYGTASFRVSYTPSAEHETCDDAIMIADAKWIDKEGCKSTKLLSSTSSQASFRSLVASVVSLPDVNEGSNDEELSGEMKNNSVTPRNLSRTSINSQSTSTVSRSTVVSSASAIRESPRGILRIELSGESVRPSLILDRRKRGPDQRQYLGFIAWSTRATQHPSFFKSMTFLNDGPIRLPCLVYASPPFFISQSRIISSTNPSLRKEEAAALEEKYPGQDGQKNCIPPGGTLMVTLQFRPEAVDVEKLDVNQQLRGTSKGTCYIDFVNGDKQTVELEGTLVRPTILCTPPYFDFGYVHVESSCRTELKLVNPTIVPSEWKIVHVPSRNDFDDLIQNKSKDCTVDDPSCWSFDLENGVVLGPTLPLGSTKGIVPKGLNSEGKRCPQSIHVCFQPSKEVQYESHFQIVVRGGPSFRVLLRGKGSYSEEDDRTVKTLPRPDT